LSFPILFGLLYLGDYASSARKREYLATAARQVVQHNQAEIEQMGNYAFEAAYVKRTAEILQRISQEEEDFPFVSLLVQDQVGSKPTVLYFRSYSSWGKDEAPTKPQFIFSCSPEERKYLASAFAGKTVERRFSASDGSYELYYPVKTGKRVLVLYFTDQSQYGKIGS
jgi:hypothetical protein